MATSNVEELLSLAASLYEGLKAKQVLRKPELLLSPLEQERLLKDAAKRKRDFIPKKSYRRNAGPAPFGRHRCILPRKDVSAKCSICAWCYGRATLPV